MATTNPLPRVTFDDGTYVSHCWACGHEYHAARTLEFARCRCCYKASVVRRALPDGLCPLDSED